ncbi:MAG: hypothetical protein ACI4O7_00160 [Aristaeellaceae bacterium]
MEPMKQVLGLELDEALRYLRAMGVEPEVVTTCAPGTSREGGTLRVIRVRGNEITVSAFQDAIRE